MVEKLTELRNKSFSFHTVAGKCWVNVPHESTIMACALNQSVNISQHQSKTEAPIQDGSTSRQLREGDQTAGPVAGAEGRTTRVA